MVSGSISLRWLDPTLKILLLFLLLFILFSLLHNKIVDIFCSYHKFFFRFLTLFWNSSLIFLFCFFLTTQDSFTILDNPSQGCFVIRFFSQDFTLFSANISYYRRVTILRLDSFQLERRMNLSQLTRSLGSIELC